MPPKAKPAKAISLPPPPPAPEPPPPPAPPSVSVLVPWRSGDPDRELAWTYLRALWTERYPTWEVVEGFCPDGPWRKGAAVADALSRAAGDIVVVADADVWCDDVGLAVDQVRAGAGWAMPHYRVCRLTAVATAQAVETREWPTRRVTLTYDRSPYPGVMGGGISVMTRQTYVSAPIDPRFSGWGQEDEAWALALRRLVGKPWRGTADLWHLWHRPQPRQSRLVGNQAGQSLYRRYAAAARDPRRMTALLAEIAS